MTLDELKEFNGKDGKKSYIGYKGNVYDISDSNFWPSGLHVSRFNAGEDLTEYISMAPHGEKNILKFPCVAKIEADKSVKNQDKMAKLQKLYAIFHPHPMMVHFPIALFIFAFILQMIMVAFNEYVLLIFNAQIIVFVFASIMLIPAIISGAASLYINYGCKANKYLKRKIILSMILLLLSVVGNTIIYMSLSGKAINLQPYFYCYNVVNVLAFITVSGIGYYGGKLTWGGK